MVRVSSKDFLILVRELYLENPCQISSIAFWKLEQICQTSETYWEKGKGYSYLYAIRNNRLMFYWSDNLNCFFLSTSEIEKLDFLVLHENHYKLLDNKLDGYDLEVCNPLIFRPGSIEKAVEDNKFFVEDFDFSNEQEFQYAAEMLNKCYETEHHNAAELKEWKNVLAFDSSFWIWVRSYDDNKVIGLGISTYQESIRESYLDWIQVLPEYQGKGAGRLLVVETVRRAKEKSDIIRVTGTVNEFYQKCGFIGTERWYIIGKRPLR